MKKNIEWLKEEIGELPCVDTVFNSGGSSYIDSAVPVMTVYDLIDQLDEPEVLSQEWIRNNQERKGIHFFVNVTKLQNLLVPKQELPVIPQFVADYIKKAKKEIDLLRVFEIANGLDELDIWRKEYNWIRLYHLDFARAWLCGYEVEEEKLYYLKFSENQYAQRFDESKIDSILVNDKELAGQFTEEQIKKVNPNLMALAVEVAE